jgi:hypothetical protein
LLHPELARQQSPLERITERMKQTKSHFKDTGRQKVARAFNVKRSKKEKSPRSQKGFSKGKHQDTSCLGAFVTKDALSGATTNELAWVIKRQRHPRNKPDGIPEVLQGTPVIEEGVVGNNVTTGPL